jgi:hypothetical protein
MNAFPGLAVNAKHLCLANFVVVAPFGRERERDRDLFSFVDFINDALYQHTFVKVHHIPLLDVSGSVTQSYSIENHDWPHTLFTLAAT